MSPQDEPYFPRPRIPPIDRSLITPRNERGAVRAEHDGADRGFVPLQRALFLTCRRVPQFDRFVRTPSRQYLAVAAVGDGSHPARVSPEHGPLLAPGHIP